MIRLRRAKPEDGASLGNLFRRSRRLLTFLPHLHTAEEDNWFIREIVLQTQLVTVAEQDDALLAFMAEDGDCITQLYVEPALRRLGAGSILVGDAKTRHDELWLWCFASNTPARAFYEKHGFVAERFTDGSDNEERQPDVLYRWFRSPGG